FVAGPQESFVQKGLEPVPCFVNEVLAVVRDNPDLEPLAFLHRGFVALREGLENLPRRAPQISDSPSADFEIKSVPSIAETVTLLGEIAVVVASVKKARRERRAVYPHRETPGFPRDLFRPSEDLAAHLFSIWTRCDCWARSDQ